MGAFYGNVVTGENANSVKDISTITINGSQAFDNITTLNFKDDNYIIISKEGTNTLLLKHKDSGQGAIDLTNLTKSINESQKTFDVISYKFDKKGHCIDTKTYTINLSKLFELISNNTTKINAEIDNRKEAVKDLKDEIEKSLKTLEDKDKALVSSINNNQSAQNTINIQTNSKIQTLETQIEENTDSIEDNSKAISNEVKDRKEAINNLQTSINSITTILNNKDKDLIDSINAIQNNQNTINIQTNLKLETLQRLIEENTESIEDNSKALDEEVEKIAHKVSVIDLSGGTSKIDYPTVWAVYDYVRQQTADIVNKEDLSNKTQTVVDDINKYPSSKAVLNALKLKENILNKTDDFEQNINSKNYLSTQGLKDIMTPSFNPFEPSTSKNNIATDNYVLEALDSKPGRKVLNTEGAEIFNDYTNNKAISYYALAANENTQAKGRASVALNRDTEAKGDFSIALGQGSITNDTAQVAIGKYNSPIQGAFVIGNGTKDDNRSNAFLIDWEGNTVQAGVVTAPDAIINGKSVQEWFEEKLNKSAQITSNEIPQVGGVPTQVIEKIDDEHYFTAAGTMNASYQTTMMLMDLFDVDKHIEQFENIPSAEFYGNELIFQFIGQTGNYKVSENDEGIDLYYGSFYKAHSPRDGAFTKFDLILPFNTTEEINENSTNIQFVSAKVLYNYLEEQRNADTLLSEKINEIDNKLQTQINNSNLLIQNLEQSKATKTELENIALDLEQKEEQLSITIESNHKEIKQDLKNTEEQLSTVIESNHKEIKQDLKNAQDNLNGSLTNLDKKIDNEISKLNQNLSTQISNNDINSRNRDQDLIHSISDLRDDYEKDISTLREETAANMELLAGTLTEQDEYILNTLRTEINNTAQTLSSQDEQLSNSVETNKIEIINNIKSVRDELIKHDQSIINSLNAEVNNINSALDLGLSEKEDLSNKVDTLFGAKPFTKGEYPTAQAVREYVEYYQETKGIEELWQDIKIWELNSGVYKCHGVIYYNETEYCHSDRSDYTDYSVILLVSKSGGTQLSHTTFMLCYTSSDIDSEFLIPHYKTGFCSVIEGKVSGFIDEIQVVSNLVQDINLNSLATTYPSAKAVYEHCYKMQQRLENALNQLEETFSYIFDVPLAMIGDTSEDQKYINSSSALLGGYETVPDNEKGNSYYTQEDLNALIKQIGERE